VAAAATGRQIAANGSIRSVVEKSNSYNNVNGNTSSSNNSNNNNILSSINNSTRSLKRTSTGVSRSSSVRRSSFRDKEKAARKLDTSFKDVLYATENQDTTTTSTTTTIPNELNSNQNSDPKSTNQLNYQQEHRENPMTKPIVINHLKNGDFVDTNNKIVKIISNNVQNQLSTNSDDFNNNQLSTNPSKPTSQIARIHSNGSATFPIIPHPRQQQQQQQQQQTSSNFSMASSILSSTSSIMSKAAAAAPNLEQKQNSTDSTINTTLSSHASAVAVAVVAAPPINPAETTRPIPVRFDQPMRYRDGSVKYKFTSNETIGARETHRNEFSDINIDVKDSKFWKCSKCHRCSIM
jgi:hypothetical protein